MPIGNYPVYIYIRSKKNISMILVYIIAFVHTSMFEHISQQDGLQFLHMPRMVSVFHFSRWPAPGAWSGNGWWWSWSTERWRPCYSTGVLLSFILQNMKGLCLHFYTSFLGSYGTYIYIYTYISFAYIVCIPMHSVCAFLWGQMMCIYMQKYMPKEVLEHMSKNQWIAHYKLTFCWRHHSLGPNIWGDPASCWARRSDARGRDLWVRMTSPMNLIQEVTYKDRCVYPWGSIWMHICHQNCIYI